MMSRFYHSQQYTLNKDKNQGSDTSALRYICFYLRQDSSLKYEKVPKVTARQYTPSSASWKPVSVSFFLANTLYVFFFKKSKIFGCRVLRQQYALPKPTKIADIPISHHLVCLMVSLVNGVMFSQVNTQPMIRYLCLYLLSLARARLFTANAAEMS